MRPELRCGIQTCPGAIISGCLETNQFARPPKLRKPSVPNETQKTRNVIWSRVHQVSARDDFSQPDAWQKHVLGRTTSKASEHQNVA